MKQQIHFYSVGYIFYQTMGWNNPAFFTLQKLFSN